jgi:hypothetical protein
MRACREAAGMICVCLHLCVDRKRKTGREVKTNEEERQKRILFAFARQETCSSNDGLRLVLVLDQGECSYFNNKKRPLQEKPNDQVL